MRCPYGERQARNVGWKNYRKQEQMRKDRKRLKRNEYGSRKSADERMTVDAMKNEPL